MPLSDIDCEAPVEETADDPAEIQPTMGEVVPPDQESAPAPLGGAEDDGTETDEEPVKTVRPGNWAAPPRPDASNIIQHYHTRLETARSRMAAQPGNDEQWAALVEQAITLLEGISQHPALSNYSANQRMLDEVEQRLGYGAYPQ